MAAGLLSFNRFLGKANQLDPISSGTKREYSDSETKNGLYSTALTNFDVTNDFKLRSRKGSVLSLSGDIHGMSPEAPGYFVSGSNLCRLTSIDASTGAVTYVVLAPVTPGKHNKMFYLQVADRLFYSNGIDSGVILPGNIRRPWGIANPTPCSAQANGGGLLNPGVYTITYTYVGDDGRESGSNGSVSVDVALDGGSIGISNIGISSDPSVKKKNIYVSEANGAQMYYFTTVSNATTSVDYSGGSPLGSPMTTMFKTPPPPGGPLVLYKGQIYIVAGQTVYATDPMSYEHYSGAFLSMESTIKMFRAVNDGIYVGDEGTVQFLAGSGMEDFKPKTVCSYPVIPFSDLNAEESEGAPGAQIIFSTTRGICIGADGGAVKNMTYGVYHLPLAQGSAPLIRLNEDVHQYIVVLQQPGVVENKYSGPTIAKTIINNYT